jgi:hypothetical protein
MESVVDCGLSISESLASYDQSTSLWKTSQLSLEGESTEFSGTWPASGMVRNGKLYMRQTLGCLIVENESLLLPTPTRSFGVNARGWGLSQTGRLRYSQQVQDNALRFTFRPPIALLEWMMGFPENHTAIELAASGMPLSLRQQNGSGERSLITTKCSTEVETIGLTISSDVTYEEWEDIGYQLARVGKGWQWWVGDWINFGEKKYGETYKAAIDATGLARNSCKNIAIVCRQFELARRRASLSFNHHAEVQGLELSEQDELLAEAEEDGLSCAAIRARVKSLKGVVTNAEAEELPADEAEPFDDDDPLIIDVVEAFDHCDNRLNTLKEIVGRLAAYERLLLIQWLTEPS